MLPDHGIFNALDQINIKREIAPRGALVIGGIVDAIAVDGNQNTGIEIARLTKTPSAQVVVLAIVCGVNSGKAGECFIERAPAINPYILAGDDAGCRSGLLLFLFIF